VEKNIYETFGLSLNDDPMMPESLDKIKNTIGVACTLNDPSEFLSEMSQLMEYLRILFDPEKKQLYDKKLRKETEENMKQRIKGKALEIIQKKLPSGCFIEDLDCGMSVYDTLGVWITISKPTGKWVELYRDRADTYGRNPIRNYSSPGAPYFNSLGYKEMNSYGVLSKDKKMPEYIKDLSDCPILLDVPKEICFREGRELRTVVDSNKIKQLEKNGISLINGKPRDMWRPCKRMIVSSLYISYFFPSEEITDDDIEKFESLLDQIEVVSELQRVVLSFESENYSVFDDNPVKECIEYFYQHYALDYHVKSSKCDSKIIYTLEMGIPVNKFEKFKEEAAKFNVNYVDYEETGRDQSLGNTILKYNQESSSIRK